MSVIIEFDDLGGPDHAADFDVTVWQGDQKVETGRLNKVPRNLGWTSLAYRYLDHRLCTACPDASSAAQPASSTRGNRRAAR